MQSAAERRADLALAAAEEATSAGEAASAAVAAATRRQQERSYSSSSSTSSSGFSATPDSHTPRGEQPDEPAHVAVSVAALQRLNSLLVSAGSDSAANVNEAGSTTPIGVGNYGVGAVVYSSSFSSNAHGSNEGVVTFTQLERRLGALQQAYANSAARASSAEAQLTCAEQAALTANAQRDAAEDAARVACVQAQEARMKLTEQDSELRRLQAALRKADVSTSNPQPSETISSGSRGTRRRAADKMLRSYDFDEDGDNEDEETASGVFGLSARPPLKVTPSAHPAAGPSPPPLTHSSERSSTSSDEVEEVDNESNNGSSNAGAESDGNSGDEENNEEANESKRGKRTAKLSADEAQSEEIAQLYTKLEQAEARAHAAEELASELQEQRQQSLFKQPKSSELPNTGLRKGTKSSKLATTATSSSRNKGVLGSTNEEAAMMALEAALESERQEKQRLATALAAAYAKETTPTSTSQPVGDSAAILGQQAAERELESERALHEGQLKLLRAQFVR